MGMIIEVGEKSKGTLKLLCILLRAFLGISVMINEC